MINISHPKISGKPPLRKPIAAMQPEHGRTEIASKDVTVADSASSCSFEQLRGMIDELERDVAGRIPEIDLLLQLEPERDGPEWRVAGEEATYEDVASFLSKLEQADPSEGTDLARPERELEHDATMLEKLFADSRLPTRPARSRGASPGRELAATRLELEEKTELISALEEQLRSERKTAGEKLTAERRSGSAKLRQLEEKYRGIVRRHQKFIEQLIGEKTDLTEKCDSLAQRVSEIEIRMRREAKAAAERHAVELQRAKERYAAAEKIKRERWIESRTAKIKEMTVKGLEPELRDTLEKHAEEIQRLRAAHASELQEAELRVVRRSNAQLEQLRLELTASHQRILASEKSLLWTRCREKLEEQETRFKEKEAKLAEELRDVAARSSEERTRLEGERDAREQALHERYRRDAETLTRQHAAEKQALRDSLRAEWEAWLTEYRKQQNARIEQIERNARDECSRERDRQIEIAIERLEKESRETKLALRRTFDRELSALAEKLEANLRTARSDEQACKEKLMLAEEELRKSEARLAEAEKRLRRTGSELTEANEVIERLSWQRDSAQKLARQEIDGEKRELEEKIASLQREMTRTNADRDASMGQLHTRIKLIVARKELTIKSLNRELDEARAKCRHLETLLDQQRKQYILKNV